MRPAPATIAKILVKRIERTIPTLCLRTNNGSTLKLGYISINDTVSIVGSCAIAHVNRTADLPFGESYAISCECPPFLTGSKRLLLDVSDAKG